MHFGQNGRDRARFGHWLGAVPLQVGTHPIEPPRLRVPTHLGACEATAGWSYACTI